MRTQQEMLELILGVAGTDERIRAVGMNGSRVNPSAPKDRFQDYDIVYLVTDIDSFKRHPDWIDVFGERIIVQLPDDNALFPGEENDRRYAYLMLFADGNRIDLTLRMIEDWSAYAAEDKLTVILLDKDGVIPPLPSPSDENFRVRRPTAGQFAGCCNEFWWVSTYVAKGLWRKEMLYALDHLNFYVRPMLVQMLAWQAGIQTDFAVSIGKNAKYLDKYIRSEQWQTLLSTFAAGERDAIWQALFAMGDLFRETAVRVAGELGFAYNRDEDDRVTAYLQRVQAMQADE